VKVNNTAIDVIGPDRNAVSPTDLTARIDAALRQR
jgi:hypothetical protein